MLRTRSALSALGCVLIFGLIAFATVQVQSHPHHISSLLCIHQERDRLS